MENSLRVGYSGFALMGVALIITGCHSPSASESASKDSGVSVAARRSVKTAIDPDASKIDTAAQDTTIEDIVARKGPKGGALGARVPPFETSTWRVKARLTSVRLMPDHDYYLVMKGSKGGETVVEVPDPKECKGSPLLPQITAARKLLEERYHPTATTQTLNDSATVTGVGFLGFGGKSSGKGRSGPRLMPGLGFDFDKKG